MIVKQTGESEEYIHPSGRPSGIFWPQETIIYENYLELFSDKYGFIPTGFDAAEYFKTLIDVQRMRRQLIGDFGDVDRIGKCKEILSQYDTTAWESVLNLDFTDFQSDILKVVSKHLDNSNIDKRYIQAMTDFVVSTFNNEIEEFKFMLETMNGASQLEFSNVDKKTAVNYELAFKRIESFEKLNYQMVNGIPTFDRVSLTPYRNCHDISNFVGGIFSNKKFAECMDYFNIFSTVTQTFRNLSAQAYSLEEVNSLRSQLKGERDNFGNSDYCNLEVYNKTPMFFRRLNPNAMHYLRCGTFSSLTCGFSTLGSYLGKYEKEIESLESSQTLENNQDDLSGQLEESPASLGFIQDDKNVFMEGTTESVHIRR